MVKSFLESFSSNNSSRKNAGFLAVVLISVLFIIYRLLMPIKFDGSYIDEYWHITSGISLIETGDYAYLYNYGKGYDRGTLMSLWVGLWVTLFGKSILVAKLAPVSIAIINYVLFLYLTTRLVAKRRFQILLLALYTLSPWVIFNHFYIRFYITNELFLLILLVLGYQLYEALRDNNWKRVLQFLSMVILLDILSMVAIRDQSEYMIMLASGVMLAGLFIYEFNPDVKHENRLTSVVFRNVLLSNEVYRAFIVLVVAIIGSIVLDASSKLDFLLHGTISYSSMPRFKYDWFFWEKNAVITVFFTLGVAAFWWKSSGYERIVLPVAGVLLLVHFIASEDLQIIRGILYFMPLYYLAAVLGLSKLFSLVRLSESVQWFSYSLIVCVFLFVTVTNVTRGFYLWGPSLTLEIDYNEYARVYNAVNNNCQGKLIVEAAPLSPFIAEFYGVDVDYALSTEDNLEQDELYVFDASKGKFKTVWGNVPVITDLKSVKPIHTDICLVVRIANRKKHLPETIETILQDVDKSWHFHNLDLYLLEQKILMGNQ